MMSGDLPGGPFVALPRSTSGPALRAFATAGVMLGLFALSGCGTPPCETTFRGGCVGGPPVAPRVTQPPPAVAAPVPAAAPAASVAPAAPAVPYGDPSTFADVDDKQCRSYGLTFGSHDYADCRIRLSAQHRGLDPNIGTAPAGSGTR